MWPPLVEKDDTSINPTTQFLAALHAKYSRGHSHSRSQSLACPPDRSRLPSQLHLTSDARICHIGGEIELADQLCSGGPDHLHAGPQLLEAVMSRLRSPLGSTRNNLLTLRLLVFLTRHRSTKCCGVGRPLCEECPNVGEERQCILHADVISDGLRAFGEHCKDAFEGVPAQSQPVFDIMEGGCREVWFQDPSFIPERARVDDRLYGLTCALDIALHLGARAVPVPEVGPSSIALFDKSVRLAMHFLNIPQNLGNVDSWKTWLIILLHHRRNIALRQSTSLHLGGHIGRWTRLSMTVAGKKCSPLPFCNDNFTMPIPENLFGSRPTVIARVGAAGALVIVSGAQWTALPEVRRVGRHGGSLRRIVSDRRLITNSSWSNLKRLCRRLELSCESSNTGSQEKFWMGQKVSSPRSRMAIVDGSILCWLGMVVCYERTHKDLKEVLQVVFEVAEAKTNPVAAEHVKFNSQFATKISCANAARRSGCNNLVNVK
ncbi:hypothetical protein KC339_g30 [Hortaea werneckii]|nr:hypothetical protein KC339_g30 [Hortaea werneckii]